MKINDKEKKSIALRLIETLTYSGDLANEVEFNEGNEVMLKWIEDIKAEVQRYEDEIKKNTIEEIKPGVIFLFLGSDGISYTSKTFIQIESIKRNGMVIEYNTLTILKGDYGDKIESDFDCRKDLEEFYNEFLKGREKSYADKKEFQMYLDYCKGIPSL